MTGSNPQAIDQFINHLKQSFQVRDLGTLSYLGVEAIRDSCGIHIRQARYINDLLDRTNMTGAKPLSSPTIS